jgi:hypothetical protein
MAPNRHDVVKTVFPSAVSLLVFCADILDARFLLLEENDSDGYKSLLHNTLVIPPVVNVSKIIVSKVQPYPIGETIGRLVSQCVRSNISFREQNCLALGYRSKSVNADATMRGSNDTEVYFVNTVQSIVTTQHWQLFANRIGRNAPAACTRHVADRLPVSVGEEVVRQVFSQSVFVPGENSCYIQVRAL